MKIFKLKLAPVALVLFVLAGIEPAHANLLDFTGNVCSASTNGSGALTPCSNGSLINQSYGDVANANVTFTDLIDTGKSLKWWDNNYNNLSGVVAGGFGDSVGQSWDRIEIEPIGNFSVTLNSFDMGAYFETQMDTNLRILDSVTNTVLLDYGVETIGIGNVATAFLPNITSANGIAIEWKDSGYNVGIDNIDFSVTASTNPVPAPATIWLLGLGLFGLLGFAKKKAH
jgi:hypothetical protein